MFYYVYIPQSQKDRSLYIGYSHDLKKRVEEHNRGESQFTHSRMPYKLIFYEAFLREIDANNREIYLKSGWGLRSIKKLLSTLKINPK